MQIFVSLGIPAKLFCNFLITTNGDAIAHSFVLLMRSPGLGETSFVCDWFGNGHVTQVGNTETKGSWESSFLFYRENFCSFSGPDWVQNAKSEMLSLSLYHSRGETNVLKGWVKELLGKKDSEPQDSVSTEADPTLNLQLHKLTHFLLLQPVRVGVSGSCKDTWNFHFTVLEVFIHANISSALTQNTLKEVIRVIHSQCWSRISGVERT